MRSTLTSIAALLAGVMLFMLASGLLNTLLAVQLAEAGLGSGLTGLVLSAYYAGMLVGALHAHRVIRMVGHIRVFALFCGLLTATALAHALAFEPLLWSLLRFGAGFSMAGLFLVTESWLSARATVDNRGSLLSVYMIVSQCGLIVGQLLFGTGDPAGDRLFILVALGFALALTPVALTRTPQPEVSEESHLPLLRLYRISPIGVIGTHVAGLTQGAFWALGPVYAGARGLDASGIALFMGAVIAGGMLMQYPLGALSDRIGRERVYVMVLFGLVLCSLATRWLPPGDTPWLLMVAPLYGGFLAMLYPLAVAQTNDWLRPEEMVAAAGGLLLGFGVGATAGPTLAGALMARLGPEGFFVFPLVLSFSFLLFLLWRMFLRPVLPSELQAPYVPLMRTSAALFEMDERYDEQEQLELFAEVPQEPPSLPAEPIPTPEDERGV